MSRKRILLLGIVVLLGSLVGCSDKEQKTDVDEVVGSSKEWETDTEVEETFEETEKLWDNQNLQTDFAQSAGLFWVEVPGGFYYQNDLQASKLMYWDEKTNQSVPLCSAPECAHDTYECGAARFPGTQRIRVYEGKLYYWSPVDPKEETSDWKLCCCDMNGSQEKVIYVVPYEDMLVLPIGSYGDIYEGKWYTRNYSGRNSEQICWVSQWDVEEKEEPRIFYDTRKNDLEWEERRVGFDLVVHEGSVYWTVIKYRERDGKLEHQSDLYRYHIENGTVEMIYQNDKEGSWFLADGMLYYCPSNETDQPVVRINLETGEEEIVISEGGILTYDGKYIYLTKGYNTGLWIYTKEGELIEHIQDDYEGTEYYALTSSEYIVFQWTSMMDNGSSGCVYRLLPKTQIGEKEKEFIEIATEE